jgi:hypothetical protein
MGTLKFTTLASIAPSGAREQMAVLMPFSRARCSNFIGTIVWTRALFKAMAPRARPGRAATTLASAGTEGQGGCKVVALCGRNCNVIVPSVSTPGNRNVSPLLREALPQLTRLARAVGLDLRGSVVSLDGVYDCRRNRRANFNRGM